MTRPADDSMYGFMEDEYEAPIAEKATQMTEREPPERKPNWQANREPGDNKYNNKTEQTHSVHYDRQEQKNESKIAYWRMFSGQMPKGEFEQNVNIAFGGKVAIGADYRGNMLKYISIYKEMMQKWNDQ